nr:MAG TPA_asm: tail protein [Caudoviricetes sp.]
MERQLINYLPFILRDIPTFRAAMDAQQPEFSNLWDSVADLQDNLFILSAGSRGLSRWEKILGLLPKASDTLAVRRARILAVLNRQLPYTLPQLRGVLYSLYGPGAADADVAENSYILRVTIPFTDAYSETMELVDTISPKNLLTRYSIFLGSTRPPVYVSAAPCSVSMSITARLPKITRKGATP